MYYRDMICLANSRKYNGFCIAGKDAHNFQWIRPVAATDEGEIPDKYQGQIGKTFPLKLDIIRVPLSGKKYHPYQAENILVAQGDWKKIGYYDANLKNLEKICENRKKIWRNDSEKYPKNDRVHVDSLKKIPLKTSLMFIRPDVSPNKIKIKIEQYNGKKKIRAIFFYKAVKYNLVVTDPLIEERFKNKKVGTYDFLDSDSSLKCVYLCISLGEPLKEHCYKLVAGIITCYLDV